MRRPSDAALERLREHLHQLWEEGHQVGSDAPMGWINLWTRVHNRDPALVASMACCERAGEDAWVTWGRLLGRPRDPLFGRRPAPTTEL